MTMWLKRGDPIPPCRPVRYHAYAIYRKEGFSPTLDHASEDDGEAVMIEEQGVTVLTPRRAEFQPNSLDRIDHVTTLYPWHTVNSVVTEKHERVGEHDFGPLDVRPEAELAAEYPGRVGMWCERCNTIRPLTEDEQQLDSVRTVLEDLAGTAP